jgi:pimeloyl-ACP methyl ester carboxylesterase
MTSASASSRFVERNQVKLHHLDWGNEGQHPIVLVHGIRLHAHVWSHFGRRFSDRYHILALDQRGHGDSGWGPAEHYNPEEFYEDLCAVVKERGLKKFTLIGHSMGGRVSMLYASRHPETLERLVFVDITPGRPAGMSPTADMSRITETPPPQDYASPEEAATYLKKIMKLAPPEGIDESVRFGMRKMDNGRYTWKYDPALFRRATPSPVDMWAVVKSIPVPTLLMYGSHSNVVTPELAEQMGKTMPSCTVERVERAGHGLFTDQPEAFADGVERFLGTK